MADSQNTVSSGTPEGEITNRTVAHLQRMRYFRKQYDQRRAYFYRQYLGQRDQRYYPDNITPRSNTFVPYPLSNVETIVARTLDAYFSYEDWFECRGRSSKDEDAAEKMQKVLLVLLKKAKLVEAFEALVRNIVIYGQAAIKVDWDWEYDWVTYSEPQYAINPETGQPIIQPVPDLATGQMNMQPVILGYKPARKQVPRSCPRFTAVDVYDFMVDPDGGIMAHLTERTLGQMRREMEMSMLASQTDPTKAPVYNPQAFMKLDQKIRASEKEPDSVIVRLAEVWNEFDQTQTVVTFGEDAEAVSWKDLRSSYRAASYSPYKRKVYAGEPILLYHGEQPFAHKKAPLLFTSFIKIPNEIFGMGAIEIISDLTEGLNKFVNMITDNWNLGINHRYAYDTNTDIDHEALNSFNVPGGRVAVNGPPDKAILPLPFFTPAPGDYQIMDVYKGMIEAASGVSDFYGKGVGSPTNNKTATGINSVIQESNFRFRMFIRNLELDVLQPMLGMCASMVQQYFTDPMELQVTGEYPGIKKFQVLTPEELIGTLDFDLVAANYASNRMIRQRNLMALFNMFGQSEVFAQYINPYETMKECFKAFEVRNIDKLLMTPPQVQQLQMAQQQRETEMMMLDAAMNTEGKARLQQSRPQPVGQGKGGGRPAKAQFEGKTPGAGLMSHIRDLGQSLGANALGLEGLGEMPEE